MRSFYWTNSCLRPAFALALSFVVPLLGTGVARAQVNN